MPYNLLLLPLLGGYIFVRFFNHTKFHILRSDKDRLIIRASIVGLFALIAAFAVRLIAGFVFPCSAYRFCLSSTWTTLVPFDYSDVSLIAFVIGAVGWYPLNWIWTEEYEINRAIKEDADPFELLIKRAQDENLMVLVTMVNHKAYIGYITQLFNPATPTENLSVFPMLSGYRDQTTKELHTPVNYSKTYHSIWSETERLERDISKYEREFADGLKQDGDANAYFRLIDEWENFENTIDLFQIVIPKNQIASISFYDLDVNAKYFPKRGIIHTK